MAYSGNTFLWSALLFAGAAGLALILWNWLQDKRRHWQRTVCAILCTGAVLAGVWYFWPFELAARPADQGGLRVVAEYPAEPGKSLALEGEEAEALLRLIDPIRVRRYRLWDYPPRDGNIFFFGCGMKSGTSRSAASNCPSGWMIRWGPPRCGIIRLTVRVSTMWSVIRSRPSHI